MTSVYDSLAASGVAEYVVIIEVDDSATPTTENATVVYHENNGHLLSASVEYFDAMGEPIMLPEPAYFSGDSYSSLNYERSGGNDYVWLSISDSSGNNFYLSLYGTEGSIFTSFPDSPSFVSAPTNVTMYSHIYLGQVQYFHDDPYGNLLSVVTIIPDDDGDGISNDVDACPSSDMGETVLFDGWYDSGVANYLDESGCTVIDHYAACDAEEEPVRGIRSVRSGPSNCEKAVSYDLVADGVISYAEARMLRNALYTSSTSSGPQ